MNTFGADLETFSPEDIKKSGLYRYALNPQFDILLFGYSLNGTEPVVLDCTRTNDRLELLEMAPLIYAEHTIKTAWNAAFEWYCLSVYLNRYGKYKGLLPIDQWRDTQLLAQYLGYPSSLDKAGAAIGIPEDKKKLGVGKSLIRLFCSPRKPTKRDGRTRVMPADEPEKWDLFKTYNKGDVVAEQTIAQTLSKWSVPDFVQKQWELDMMHNAMGVNVDLDLVYGAQRIAEQNTELLLKEAAEITGLDNPNSRDQLQKWLTEELPDEEIPDLRKETVSGLLDGVSEDHVKRVLEIRQETGKAAHKKYAAIQKMVCPDGRLRGLMKFYGAGRTGRWCLTGDHEVLTPTGWVRLDQWTGGQIITWNPDQETFAFNKCEALQFDYAGDLIHLKSQRFDQVSTPDHKMAVLGKNGLWEANTVGSIVKNGKRVALPFTGYREKRSAFSPWELRVLIMTQADGYYTLKGGLRYHFAKKRKVERCKTLLRMCGIPFTMFTYADKRVTINVRQVDMPLWLRSFRDKTFGMWLVDEDATVILDEIVEWDGYRCGPNSYQYSTTNRKNAEIIQLCAVLSGRTATVLTKERTNSNWNTAYVVNIWNTPGRGSIVNPRNFSTEHMDSGKVYCAKTPTGYFLVRRNGVVWVTGNSSTGVQLQNLARTHLNDVDAARHIVERGDLNALRFTYGAVSDTLGQLVRTALIPSPGNVFVDCDFSAIEARVIAWLAGEEWVLDVFRTHGKIYEATASQMFGVPMDRIKKGNPEYDLRQRGKVATLALGYQGGVNALTTMDVAHVLHDDEKPGLVKKWRSASPNIVKYWYDTENAALEALRTGMPHTAGYCTYALEVDEEHDQWFLTCLLPSGRKLFYPRPTLAENRFGKQAIRYWGIEGKSHKWAEIDTYGGRLVENQCQAVARDCLAEKLPLLEAAGYPAVFSIHDEIVADVSKSYADLKTVQQIMSAPMPWAPGLPLNAEGWVGDYFKKD